MIIYLTTRTHMNVINWYLETWGQPLGSKIIPVAYEDLFKKRNLPLATYIFADIERLSPRETEEVAWISNQLQKHNQVRLLNHPLWSMCRYELLKTLYNQGSNQFNIYRLTEDLSHAKFPVFIRGENDHKGNQTPLLKTREELDEAIIQLVNRGESRQDKVIIEFCDTQDDQGTFKKYSAFAFGNTIVPVHVRYQKGWVVKANSLKTAQREQENKTYVETNPHAEQIKAIFKIARIQYGRIDYSFRGENMQVWEINTNPTICHFKESNQAAISQEVSKNIEQAFLSIDTPTHLTERIQISLKPSPDTKLEFASSLSEALPWLPNPYKINLRRSVRKLVKVIKK